MLAVFPLAGRLSSPASAAPAAAGTLFSGIAGTTQPSDFPRSYISGVPPQRSLNGPPVINPADEQWDLPVLAHEDSVHALVLRPRGAHW